MVIKILEKDLELFLSDNGIDLEEQDKIVFLMLDTNPTEYIYIDMMKTLFDTTDSRIEIESDIEAVETEIEELNAKNLQESQERKLFTQTGIVTISSGKSFYMDSQSRTDILTTVLLSVVKPELKTPTIPWKTPEGTIDVTIEELTEALLILMQTRKDMIGL